MQHKMQNKMQGAEARHTVVSDFRDKIEKNCPLSKASGWRHIAKAETAKEPTTKTGETRDVRPSKMLLASLETESPVRPLHLTKVPETSLGRVSATYEEGVLGGPATECEAASNKDPRTNNLKDSLVRISTYPDLLVARNNIKNPLAEVYAHLDFLVERA